MDNFVADGIFIDASPERVFQCLLDPDEVRVWMEAEEAAVEPEEGGRFFARRADGSTVEGRIATKKDGVSLVVGDYTWERQGERRGPMQLRCTLEPRHGGVWITIRQDGLDTGGGNWKAFATATREELVRATVRMKRHIEGI